MVQTRIYVRPWPDVERARWQVWAGTSRGVLWAPDGRLLFVDTVDLHEWSPGDDPGSAPPARNLHPLPRFAGVIVRAGSWDLDPTDGSVLYLASEARPDTGPRTRILVVENWFGELRRRDAAP